MGSEASNSDSRRAASGSGETQMGPDELPNKDIFEGANARPGNVFGDKTMRRIPDEGANLAMGLSERMSFEHEDPDELGEGRDDSTGKPDGPQKGKVDNGGAGADLCWG